MLLDSNIIIYAAQIDDFTWNTQLKLLNPFDNLEV